MRRTIWKYTIDADHREQVIDMPEGAKLLHVETQGADRPCLWALVDPFAKTEPRTFAIIGTGWHFAADGHEHVGTFLLDGGTLVFHLFEVKG